MLLRLSTPVLYINMCNILLITKVSEYQLNNPFDILEVISGTDVTKHYSCTEHSICILFGQNIRPNSVFVFRQIILLKVDRV